MKRILLSALATWHECRCLIAQSHAHTAMQIMDESENERKRAHEWLMLRSAQLRAAQTDYERAIAAVQRHDRHRALGI